MLRLTKLADYGIVLLIHFARAAEGAVMTARDLARASHIPQPMVSRVLKLLSSEGLLTSHRGVKGGYSLARPAREISVAGIVGALEGPIGMTSCSEPEPGDCEHEAWCPAQRHWRLINQVVTGALSQVSLRDMASPSLPAQFVALEAVQAD